MRYCRHDRLARGDLGADLRSIGEAMNETLRHRGPDGSGVWVEAEGGAALAQRRLAIIDLSPGGAQPMQSADRRYVITFNGEIYNYREIRSELAAAGRPMRSDSDTEVLLEACALWGVEAAVERAVGMFAFALWDRTDAVALAGARPARHQAALLRRDARSRAVRLGAQGVSCCARLDSPTIDRDAVVGYLRHSYIAQPRTIYREAAKLPPGHILTLRAGAGAGAQVLLGCARRRARRTIAQRSGSRSEARRPSGSTRCCAIPSSCG